MNKDINQQLEHYSRISFQDDLKNLERDVKRRVERRRPAPVDLGGFIERWFGISASLSASAVASTLALGIFLGVQFQTAPLPVQRDMLGFEVFSATHAELPSSLLASKQ